MSPPHYKLTYFNMMGRAEPMRLMFAYAGVPYEDNRIEKEQWPALKSHMPNGQIPVLEVDGKQLSQSMAISTFLAKKFGLDGKDDWESAKVQEMLGALDDVKLKFRPWMMEQDANKKAEIFKTVLTETIDPYLERLSETLKKNGSGYFVGQKPTQVDFHLFHIFNWWQQANIATESVKKHPELVAFTEKMGTNPKIKQWLEKRPKTAM
uniref:glutathione transferase n=1 Tax=Plectus sambesii TaxID=2011161 RepID=A0A914W1U6_9BILA